MTEVVYDRIVGYRKGLFRVIGINEASSSHSCWLEEIFMVTMKLYFISRYVCDNGICDVIDCIEANVIICFAFYTQKNTGVLAASLKYF